MAPLSERKCATSRSPRVISVAFSIVQTKPGSARMAPSSMAPYMWREHPKTGHPVSFLPRHHFISPITSSA
eukprot:3957906-Ditylum_brightwellii.AAC.1